MSWPENWKHLCRPPLLHSATLAAGAQFGCAEVDDELVRRVERLTGVPAHPFLKRKVFYAHRDLAQLLDAYEKGEPFYLYTGRVRCCCVFAGCRVKTGVVEFLLERLWVSQAPMRLRTAANCPPLELLMPLSPLCTPHVPSRMYTLNLHSPAQGCNHPVLSKRHAC